MSIGLNILGDRGLSNENIVAAASRLNAKYHVVMDNAQLAAMLHGVNGCQVIYRMHANDDNAHAKTDPVLFVQQRHSQAPVGTLLYLGNEPGATQQLADWTLAAMKECDRLGRKGVILNFSTGNPEPEDWLKFKPVLQYAVDNGHILGLHEYFDVDWRKDYPYHVGRFLKIAELGLPVPKIVITEIGAVIGYVPDRGYRWADRMTDGHYGGVLVELDREIYNPLNMDVCVFAYTNDSSDDDWHTFHPRDTVMGILAEYVPEKPVINVPAPLTGGIRAELTKIPSGYVNVRNQPNGVDIGDVYQGDTGIYYPDEVHDGWVYFETDEGVNGWVSLQGGNVVFTPITPEPEPEPEPKQSIEDILDSLHSQVIGHINAIRDAYYSDKPE